MPGAMRAFLLIVAVFLLAQIFSARGGPKRHIRCAEMAGRCEIECLTFEDKLGGCRSELTPFCCIKRKRN
ncbi:beta-defensin 107A-like [Pipistrellus kuhlii]|uniref:beta-defensin 107A-like n=1 Tax=Pipistrellus kuhlii TaxID=59472 RepID=UPI001E26F8BD|nr:beta-defensin 107A-like [Pipistrellus kuhlii]